MAKKNPAEKTSYVSVRLPRTRVKQPLDTLLDEFPKSVKSWQGFLSRCAEQMLMEYEGKYMATWTHCFSCKIEMNQKDKPLTAAYGRFCVGCCESTESGMPWLVNPEGLKKHLENVAEVKAKFIAYSKKEKDPLADLEAEMSDLSDLDLELSSGNAENWENDLEKELGML